MSTRFFGIDGGGSQSRLAVYDANGTRLAWVAGGSTNRYTVGFEPACMNIRALIQEMQNAYGIDVRECAAGCFASAGLTEEAEKDSFRRFFLDENIRIPIFLCNDALAALTGGTGKKEGMIVVSGTGSIAAGMDMHGNTVRAGGLGHLISDEGSGFKIGLDGIRAATAAWEHHGAATILTPMLFAHYQINTIRELFPFLYTRFDKSKIASFALSVFQAARQRDAIATAILHTAAHELASLARSVYDNLFSETAVELVFSGGVLDNEPVFARQLAAYITDSLPHVRIIRRRFDAATGACILAGLNLPGTK